MPDYFKEGMDVALDLSGNGSDCHTLSDDFPPHTAEFGGAIVCIQ
jgi:hypothetical protein